MCSKRGASAPFPRRDEVSKDVSSASTLRVIRMRNIVSLIANDSKLKEKTRSMKTRKLLTLVHTTSEMGHHIAVFDRSGPHRRHRVSLSLAILHAVLRALLSA